MASAGSEAAAPSRPAHSPYQIIIHRDEAKQTASVPVGRKQVPLDEATYERIACDARVLEPGKRNRASIPPAIRQQVLARDGHRCQAPGCGSGRFLEVHHIRPRKAGGSNKPDNMITLCAACHSVSRI